ncbi:MAG: hypothetical protein QOJ35_2987 [Solirubrobacteraceae bacterium]|jgi:ketosteroid isomerase-like protein|nr:hypothetical protein [Solirubrobacteraceae bacterium]
MSENVAPLPIRDAYVAISQLDADALVALCDPAVRFESRITAVEDATYEGHEGARRYIANIAGAFDQVEVETSDVVVDRDRAAITNLFRARGRGSGVQVEERFFVAAKGRRGKLLWWGMFDSEPEALEAAGLSDSDS